MKLSLSLLFLSFIIFQTMSCTSTPVRDMSNMETAMIDCTYAPNCVSSLATDSNRKVEPIPFKGAVLDYQRLIKAVFKDWPQAEIVRVERNYMHVICSTPYMKFKDDVEMYFIPEKSLIHIRSSARLGYYDFDVNRDRVEQLRENILLRTQGPPPEVQSGKIELSPPAAK